LWEDDHNFYVLYDVGQDLGSFLESSVKNLVFSFLISPEFIFRAPIKLSKPGEFREEYESLRKV